MQGIINEVKENNDNLLLIVVLYITYFVGYTIGCVKRIIRSGKNE